ncbi:MAG: glycosyltransferase family 2 protein [Planctomycetota bacterium]|jgi:glycosyltransferase involved in cell wall biosynthesis
MDGLQVGVVIPCRSYRQWLPEALDSVEAQTDKPYYVAMVQDGVDGFTDYYDIWLPRVKRAAFGELVHLTTTTKMEGMGVCTARNMGFEKALEYDLEWIVPLDEDDVLHPRFVEYTLRSAALLPEHHVHYTDWTIFGNTCGYTKTPEFSTERLLAAPFIPATSLIHRSVWERVKEANGTGYDTELDRLGLKWEDYLFYLEAAALGIRMARVGIGLLRVRRHGESRTTEADRTTIQWYDYAAEKLKRLYNFEVSWQQAESS